MQTSGISTKKGEKTINTFYTKRREEPAKSWGITPSGGNVRSGPPRGRGKEEKKPGTTSNPVTTSVKKE